MSQDADKWLASLSVPPKLAIRQLTENKCVATDYTIGDWNTASFKPPKALIKAVVKYLKLNKVQYANVAGEIALRQQVARHWQKLTRLNYGINEVAIASGARPLLMLAAKTLLTPNDKVVYSAPNWNAASYLSFVPNDQLIRVVTEAKDGFLLTLKQLESLAGSATLVWLNLPLNPTGAIYNKAGWRELLTWWRSVNDARLKARQKPLFVIIDAVYHQLFDTSFWGTLGEFSDLFNYLMIISGAAKSCVATGMRLGWALGPSYWINSIISLNSYLGAWPGHAEQLGMADFLDTKAAITSVNSLKAKLKKLALTWQKALDPLKTLGVTYLPYQGGVYFNCYLNFKNYHFKNTIINQPEDLTSFLIEHASVAITSFKYLDAPEHGWWFRLALSMVTLEANNKAVSALLSALKLLKHD